MYSIKKGEINMDHTYLYLRICNIMSCIHKSLVVSSLSPRSTVSALLHQLSAALLLQRLPGHLLLHLRALLPGGGGALPVTHSGALLVILVPGHGDGDRVTHLLGDLIADLAGGVHIITHRLGNWVADLSDV